MSTVISSREERRQLLSVLFCIVNMTVQVGKHIIKVELNLKKLKTNCGFTCKVQKGNHFGKATLDNSRLHTTINLSEPNY